jgi:Zn-dependent protease with chaperone function
MGVYFYLEMVSYAFFLGVIPAIGVLVAFLVLDIFRPFYFQLRKLNLRKVDPKTVTRRFEELCDNNGLDIRPSICVANNPIPFSLGIHKGHSMIIIPEFLLNFEEEERESIVAHELWHIGYDVEAVYLRLFEIAGGALFTVTFLSVVLIVYFQHSVLGWWDKMLITDNYTFISYEHLFSPNFFWVVFVALTFLSFSLAWQ